MTPLLFNNSMFDLWGEFLSQGKLMILIIYFTADASGVLYII